MTLTPNLIACLAIGGAGILTALLSIPFFRRTGKLRRRCCARTEGTVIRYHYQPKQSGGPSIAPVASFQVDGVSYTACLHYRGVATVSRSANLFRNDATKRTASPCGTTSFTPGWSIVPGAWRKWHAYTVGTTLSPSVGIVPGAWRKWHGRPGSPAASCP